MQSLENGIWRQTGCVASDKRSVMRGKIAAFLSMEI